MPDSLLIPVAKADIGRRLDQLLLVLVVLAIAVAWLAEPGEPLRFIAFDRALLVGAPRPERQSPQHHLQPWQPLRHRTHPVPATGRIAPSW